MGSKRPLCGIGTTTEVETWRSEWRTAKERAEGAEHLVRAREADVEDIRQAYEVGVDHSSEESCALERLVGNLQGELLLQ